MRSEGSQRRAFLAMAGSLVAFHARTGAQTPPKAFRIGFLGSTEPNLPASLERVEALRKGLHERGYDEGRNLFIEYRWSDGYYDRLADLAAEFVKSKVDVIVSQGLAATVAAHAATASIPIVTPVASDPVAANLAASLARPAGNVTGMTWFSEEVSAKRVELMKELLPKMRRLAVLSHPDNPANAGFLPSIEAAAGRLGVAVEMFSARRVEEFPAAFAAIAASRCDAVTITDSVSFISHARELAETANANRMPSIAFEELATYGGLMAYGPNFPEMFRQSAAYVDKILKGAKPGDLPIGRATRFDLIVNQRAARKLGIAVPASIVLRASRVIE